MRSLPYNTWAGSFTLGYDQVSRRTSLGRLNNVNTMASGSTIYLYDGANVVAEAGGSGTVVASYAQGLGIDEPLAMKRNGYIAYYNADGLGSITSLFGSTGQQVAQYVYDSFGNTTAIEGIFNPFRYTGREQDSETGLYYYRARYYDPTIGRFISEDPIGFNSNDDDFYAYVGNNPIGYVDPSGYERKKGKFPNSRWPKPPKNACGKKPKWNPAGYWEGNGRRLTWDDRSHGTGVDRGAGPQGGHWDDETSNNRWDENGNLLPGSDALKNSNTESAAPTAQPNSGPTAEQSQAIQNATKVAEFGTGVAIIWQILEGLLE